MATSNHPYKVTKAPTAPQTRVHLLHPCQLVRGPLDGTTVRVRADEHGLPPATYSTQLENGARVTYRLRAGTKNYYF